MEHIDSIEKGFVASGRLDTVALEEVVINFIVTLQREANVLKLLSPMRDHNEYTFAHSTNVTLLTIFQAESIGLAGEYLREIGLAALLHDMGKMFVPKAIIEKPGKLTEAEWYEMKKHPMHGARYLSTVPEITNLAIVGAFEHHMKFDGKGYPETLRRTRGQHLVSQLIAISDFFDALRTERPYRQTMEVDVVVGMLKEGAGTDFNPNLVNHFIGSLKAVGAY
jgi:HD-GYP domain-containing protein (c-di-GMP phosphodiesterase class II)